MRILDRYIMKHLILPILFCLVTLIFLVIMADIFDHLSEMMKNKTSLRAILEYYSNLLPYAFIETIPWATLLGTTFLLVTLNTNNELLAMKAVGISMLKISRPILFIGFSIGIVAFLVNDRLVPQTFRKAQTILVEHIEASSEVAKGSNQIISNLTYFGSSNTLYYAKQFDLTRNTMENVIILFFSDDKNLSRKIFASEARWENDEWRLMRVTDYQTGTNGRLIGQPHTYEERIYPELNSTPRELATSSSETNFLSFKQLKEYIERLDSNGLKPYPEKVALHYKLASPWHSLVIMFIAIPLLSITRRKKIIAVNVLVCLLLVFLFHILGAVFLAMGKNGDIPPLVSAWTSSILFVLGSIVVMKRAID